MSLIIVPQIGARFLDRFIVCSVLIPRLIICSYSYGILKYRHEVKLFNGLRVDAEARYAGTGLYDFTWRTQPAVQDK